MASLARWLLPILLMLLLSLAPVLLLGSVARRGPELPDPDVAWDKPPAVRADNPSVTNIYQANDCRGIGKGSPAECNR